MKKMNFEMLADGVCGEIERFSPSSSIKQEHLFFKKNIYFYCGWIAAHRKERNLIGDLWKEQFCKKKLLLLLPENCRQLHFIVNVPFNRSLFPFWNQKSFFSFFWCAYRSMQEPKFGWWRMTNLPVRSILITISIYCCVFANVSVSI